MGDRYQKIFSRIWQDEKFKKLSPDTQRLFLYILTSPHSNLLGLYVLPELYACADLQLSPQSFHKSLRELLEMGVIKYDTNSSVVFVCNHLRHNPIINQNVAAAAMKIAEALPQNPYFMQVCELLPQSFHKSLRELLGKRFRELNANTESESESEPGPESGPESEKRDVYILEKDRGCGGDSSSLRQTGGDPQTPLAPIGAFSSQEKNQRQKYFDEVYALYQKELGRNAITHTAQSGVLEVVRKQIGMLEGKLSLSDWRLIFQNLKRRDNGWFIENRKCGLDFLIQGTPGNRRIKQWQVFLDWQPQSELGGYRKL